MWAITAKQTEHRRLWGSVQFNFALTYVALIAALLFLLNTYPLVVARDLVFTAKQSSLMGEALGISHALSDSVGHADTLLPDAVAQAMGYLDVVALSRLVVTDAGGTTIYDTVTGAADLATPLRFDDLHTALGGYDVFFSAYEDGVFLSWASCPIVTHGTQGQMVVGAVHLFEADAVQGEFILGIQRNLQNISIAVFVVSLFLAILFSRTLTKRLMEILSAIRVVGRGDYSHQLAVRGRDELAELGLAFNSLTERLHKTEDMRRRFVSDASHELKTPLSAICLLSDSIVQSREMDNATIREFVEDIGQEAQRLARTTEKLLALTRLDVAPEVALVPVDVGQVVQNACHMLRPVAEGRCVQISFALEEDCRILACEDDIYQIVLNLAENGIKYNAADGKLHIAVEKRSETVHLTVEDTGIGIPSEDVPHIFDRFYRVDKARSREQGSSGLGLAIVRATVHAHNGQVEVSSTQGKGTKFMVIFPAWKGD